MQPQEPAQPAPVSPPPITGVAEPANEDMLEIGEHVLTVVHRSPIGLVGIYFVAILAVAAISGLVIALAPGTFKPSSMTISVPLSGIIVLAAALLALILFVATYVYRQSRLMVTDKSLVQVMQKT
jgi:hypothetical protein